jgi:flagellar biosynthesis/type III secretory pathway protein FliH
MRDWMRPGSNPGQGMGMGQAQAQAAQAQAEQAKAETQRLAKEARQSAQKALAEARQNGKADASAGNARTRGEAWNKLASRLQKDLLQGRDNTPPEQYRQAIENYFKIISDSTADAQPQK